MSKHVHAEIIKAWAEGKKIQRYSNVLCTWCHDPNPYFDRTMMYRVAPETYLHRNEGMYSGYTINPVMSTNSEVGTYKFSFDTQNYGDVLQSAVDFIKGTITVYDHVKLFKFKSENHVGSDAELGYNVKYVFDANTQVLISVERL